MLLELKNIKGGYTANNNVLRGINLSIGENEAIAIFGQNGSGKSTLAKAIFNMLPYLSGQIYLNNDLLNHIPTEKLGKHGIVFLMQGGPVFPHLTVDENLEIAGDGLSKSEFDRRKNEIGYYFYLLRKDDNGRRKMEASYLSGGEKQQLALAMVLMKKPRLLILDEPSAGLSPENVKKLYETLSKIRNKENASILLIEQNVQFAFEFSDRVALLSQGIIEKSNVSMDEIEENYFGK
ncbi:MAG: ATP-binding cassette domain-containing protein [Candidatus Thermoplasmatota archaeon]|nr:ATP-binding cassette domain-containing protein [Candidatus Thermoplasmatota archaeon]